MNQSLSYWEKNTWFSQADVCIVGAGIVGLSTAIYLKQRAPSLNIIVLERGLLPDGASTKNAGFACFGSLSELASDLNQTTEIEVFNLMKLRIEGLKNLQELLGIENIDYQNMGGYELFRQDQHALFESSIAILDEMNRWVKEIHGIDACYSLEDEKLKSFRFQGFNHLISNRAEGQIDTGKMMNSMIQKAYASGVNVLFGIEVKSIENESFGHTVLLNNGLLIRSKKVLICTNGYAAQLLPELQVKPGRAQVLVTSVIRDLPFEGCFHMEEGYYYFRNIHGRVLFGGGRQLDKAAETTYSHETSSKIQDELERILRQQIIPEREYTIDHRWAGTMGLGNTKKPIVEELSNGIIVGVRMGGMGIAIGTRIGQELRDLTLNRI
jgi:gamma-glutamylputrescine oxidase